MNHYLQEINMYFELKGTPDSSKESYFRRINAFIQFIQDQHKCMKDISERDIQEYILYLKKEKCLSAGTINNYISGIKFFYTHVLNKEWNPKKVPRMKRSQKFPEIPPKQDVMFILNNTINLKHKAILTLIYGSGLRVSEAAKLKICDICSKTMRVRVEHAKHNTNRYTILSDTALEVLRKYFKNIFLQSDTSLMIGCFQDKTEVSTLTSKP
jgi:integrase/recombinase XerD